MRLDIGKSGSELGVVTICYNDLSGLRETVNSILGQTVRPSRVVIVDGMSTDGTAHWLLDAYLPEWVEVVREEDEGIYDAMNKGIARMSSDLIVMMNSGDRFADADVVGRILDEFHRRRWRWAYGDAVITDTAGRAIGAHALRWLPKLRFFGGLATVPHQAVIYTQEILEQVGDFRRDLGVSADQEHLMRCWLVSSPAYIRETLAVCDGSGVGSSRPIGSLARDIGTFRRINGVRWSRIPVLERMVTSVGIGFDLLRAKINRMRNKL